MINQGINVPDNTIAVFDDAYNNQFDKKNNLNRVLDKPSNKRDWFDSHFYRCLPLVIGNQQGFIIKAEYDFTFVWEGGSSPDAVKLYSSEPPEIIQNKFPRIESHFGNGVISITPPFTLRTPPGVNLMTINPPNYVIPNITVMTGIIETDNIRRNFGFNLKIQMEDIPVKVFAGTPLAAFIPIPRYYADNFELKLAEDIFDEETVKEEMQSMEDSIIYRAEVEPDLKNKVGRQYYNGEDVYGNAFPDHQKP
jgi:hypothetical protein